MVNLSELGKGIGMFVGFHILGVILSMIVPTMIGALSTVYNSANIEGTIYVGIMFIWVACYLIIPNVFIYKAVTEDTGMNTAIEILIAAAMFLFGMILTVKGWFFIEGLAAFSVNEITTVLYWLGTAIIWVEIVLGIPGYLIMRAYTR